MNIHLCLLRKRKNYADYCKIADIDGDAQLTKDEFTDPEINEVPEDMPPEQYRQDRIKDFAVADEDKNGIIDRKELLV